ncbi:MAG: sigma-70 family RNA polymerase sigma factor [Chloroflexota bacterium]
MTETQSDDLLVEAALNDPDAFAILYRRYLQRVYSYLLSKVGNKQDAQNLTTQTFMAALDGIASYQPQGNFGAWLIGIARHKVADHFRKQRRIISIDDVPTLREMTMPLDEIVNQQLQLEAVIDLLNKINSDRAEAIQLRFFANLKMQEIALIMQKSEDAVKMLVSRGLDDLRQMLNLMEKTS